MSLRLRFNNHAPQQLAVGMAFQQQASDELGRNLLSGAGEKGMVESWEMLGGRGGYWSGFMAMC